MQLQRILKIFFIFSKQAGKLQQSRPDTKARHLIFIYVALLCEKTTKIQAPIFFITALIKFLEPKFIFDNDKDNSSQQGQVILTTKLIHQLNLQKADP